MALNLTEKDIDNPEILGEKLFTLAEIVISKHFYASMQRHFDDLRSVAVLKAIRVIRGGFFDKRKGNFASLIYSSMRNEIHNHLYHENKKDSVNLDVLMCKGEEDKYFTEDNSTVYLSYSLIHSVCLSFISSFGENVENLVINKLTDLGYSIKGRKSNNLPAFSYSYDPIKEEYGKDCEEDIISRIIAIILWKRKEYDYRCFA